jgi:hypothetical protein
LKKKIDFEKADLFGFFFDSLHFNLGLTEGFAKPVVYLIST